MSQAGPCTRRYDVKSNSEAKESKKKLRAINCSNNFLGFAVMCRFQAGIV